MKRLRTDIGIWRVSTVKLPGSRYYQTAVKHVNEPQHKGYYPVIYHTTPSSARADHRMVVGLIRALVRKIVKHGHKRNR